MNRKDKMKNFKWWYWLIFIFALVSGVSAGTKEAKKDIAQTETVVIESAAETK